MSEYYNLVSKIKIKIDQSCCRVNPSRPFIPLWLKFFEILVYYSCYPPPPLSNIPKHEDNWQIYTARLDVPV